MRAADRTPLLSEIAITLLFIVLLCAPMLDAAYGGIFSYADEAITILLVLWALLARCEEKVGVHERRGLVAVGLLCILGLVGNLVFGFFPANISAENPTQYAARFVGWLNMNW